MEDKQKILVCGDVQGKFKALFSKVNSINDKSGPFDFLLCVGDFFGDSESAWQPYRDGILRVPVPTYILGPNKESQVSFFSDLTGCEIASNVSYLGKRGILKSNGLRIAYVSGLEGTKPDDYHFTEKDTTAVRDVALKTKDEFVGVDVLLTSEWPKNVTNLDERSSVPKVNHEGSKHLAWLACQLKPRYHFSGLHDIFYERPPYANYDDNTNSHCTRFIALAKVGNAGKHKWLYAVGLTPIDSMKKNDLFQITSDQTICPYARDMNRLDANKQFFYDMTTPEDKPKRRKRNDSEKVSFDDPEKCWFCLGSSSAEKHLVVSIGETVYVALAKGGLTSDHVMILPVQHHQSLTRLADDIKREIKKFKSALRKFFKKKQCVPVFFERNYKTSHLQLQVVPVPKNLSDGLKEAFISSAEEQDLEINELPEQSKLEDFAPPGTPYFYVELPTKERLMCLCKKNFPIQFGRDVLASEAILNLPEKINWRDCVASKEEEELFGQKFRKEFEPYQPFED